MGGGELESTSPLRFLPFTQKIFLRPIPEISKLLVADTPMIFFFFLFTPSDSTFETPSKFFFALIKKIFSQTLVNS